MLLTGEERAVIREALYRQAEQYIELARGKLKFDGKPKKGCSTLVPYYFEKADLLIAVASRIKI
jgi:hypothetical protein